MKLLVVGLGVIGTAYGWAFDEAGAEVVHLVRPGRAARYAGGVDLDLLDLRPGHPDHLATHYQPTVTEDVAPGDGFDMVMVPVKHYQLVDTLVDLVPRLPGTDFLLFAANWDGLEGVEAVLPRSRYAWGYSSSSGGHKGDTLVFNLSNLFRYGPIRGAKPPCYETVIDLFASADVAPDLKPDMLDWLWVHFAQAAGTISAALYAGGQEALLTDERAIRELMIPAVKDCLAVLAARGVDPRSWPDTQAFFTQPPDELAASWRRASDTEWARRSFVAGHFGENLEEMKRFGFDVMDMGTALGVDMPCLQMMRERIEGLR
jgi:2-dehydropantoate 2-reductase